MALEKLLSIPCETRDFLFVRAGSYRFNDPRADSILKRSGTPPNGSTLHAQKRLIDIQKARVDRPLEGYQGLEPAGQLNYRRRTLAPLLVDRIAAR